MMQTLGSTTVADDMRSELSIKAISPKMPPAPIVPNTFLSSSSVTQISILPGCTT